MTEPGPACPKYYLVSLLLSAGAYEAALNKRLLGELQESGLTAELATPEFLAGTPNRSFFLDSFLDELRHLPFGVKILNPEEDFFREMDFYEDGRPDPVSPGDLWRVVNLDLRLELGGSREARLLIRELPDEERVQISFAFAADTVRRGGLSGGEGNDLPRFREFLLALVAACPVLVGTLGLELDARQAAMVDDKPWQGCRMSLDQLASVPSQFHSDHSFDFVIVSGAVAGGNRPFVHDHVAPQLSFPDGEGKGCYHDLRLVKELVDRLNMAEGAYDRMYDSRYPKDDRDDAMTFLSQARTLAESLGFTELTGKIQSRYDHINAVFNSQFRY